MSLFYFLATLDKAQSNMMVQISRKKVDGEKDLPGTGTKKDQVWIAMSGISQVDFGNKVSLMVVV